MTAPTLNRPVNGSAYPPALAELMPAARLLITEGGEVPSRNALMKALKVGAPKAAQVRDALTTETTGPDTRSGESAESAPVAAVDSATLEPAADTVAARAPIEPTAPMTDPVPAAPVTVPAEPAATVTAPPMAQVTTVADPGTKTTAPRKALRTWPVWVLALPAMVAIWSGWVGLGELAGFGMVRPLPGIWDSLEFNSAITLPIGMEVYAAYAMKVWLSGSVPAAARKFAKVSALGSLGLGSLGQVAYHLMSASGMTAAPWWITTLVACLPVAVLGMAGYLAHLIKTHD
ncbi:ABC transporter permease [Phytomonospora sp. NPDC050363]|uniref:ABC transporter permease n=1 Tax=Phytomonospora sp. NPDC050363 TaxID=3155642 RepID=UPI0033DADBC4